MHYIKHTSSGFTQVETVLIILRSELKVPHHPLQSITPPSSKYPATLFKVPHHPLQSTTTHSSKHTSSGFTQVETVLIILRSELKVFS